MSNLPIKRKLFFRKTHVVEERERTWHWSYTVMIIGWFVGIVTIYTIGLQTLLNVYDFTRFIAFFCLIGLVIPFRFYRKWFKIDQLEIVLFNVMGVGPLVFSTLLLVNYFSAQTVRTEKHRIVRIESLDSSLHGGKLFYRIYLENDAYDRYPSLRRIDPLIDNFYPSSTRIIQFELAKGWLGWDVIYSKSGVAK